MSPLVVSALRFPQPAASVTSTVTVLDPQALEERGLLQLRDALNESPGVISTSTGGETGALGSLYIRGTTTGYSQMVVDGMRLGDSTSQLGNFLSASRVYDIGRLEILRGPQGAIYGGESVGGVLWMETTRGTGKPHGSLTAEGGSFDSFSVHAMQQGEVRGLSFFLSGGYEETANDAPSQRFHQEQAALRVEQKLNNCWTIGTTYRGFANYFENGGASDDRVGASLATLQATGVISDHWTARFHLGLQQESYDSDSMWGNYGTDMLATSISTDQNITINDQLLLLANGFVHHDSYENTIGTDHSSDRYGVGAALEWKTTEAWTNSGALRWEDYDPYGDELTWRVGSAYQITRTGTTLRGGVGTSFRTPTYLDLYGSSFGPGNPALNAERALGWDLGIVQTIAGQHQVQVTWFRNNIEDRIRTTSAPPVNIPGTTPTEGFEIGLNGGWLDHTIDYRLAWTVLTKNISDQPRNALNASVDWRPATAVLLGAGVAYLSDHSWGGDPIAASTVARLYGSYQLTANIKLNARVENLFNEDYELYRPNYYGGSTVKGSGTGVYGGLTFDW